MTDSQQLLGQLQQQLAEAKRNNRLRLPAAPLPADTIVLCSNDYLGLGTVPVDLTAFDGTSLGGGASRLISGTAAQHLELEELLASWLQLDASLLFSSGYAANVGTLAALAGAGDVIVSDALNHASLIDGCRLAKRATVVVVPHCDTAAVVAALAQHPTARRRFVVTESYFSMDGTTPDLRAMRQACDEHGAWLYVDEAHALGVFGPEGRGLCAQHGVVPDVLVGTLGKAVGVQGAFVAGAQPLKTYLWNYARSFVFSTALSPLLARAAMTRIDAVRKADGQRARLAQIGAAFRERLQQAGAPIMADSHGPIVPWVVGDERRALDLSQRLLAERVFVQAIRPPTVPSATARLRISLHAGLGDGDCAHALEVLCGYAALRD